MNKHLYFLSLLVAVYFSTAIFAQEFSQTSFDLGKISRLNEDVVELNIANPTAENIYLLRATAERPIDIKYTSKNILSQSAILLRIKLNPKTKGRGQSKVILYFSNLQEPVELTFNYNLKELPRNNLQACPSFNSADMAQKSLAAFNRQKKAKIKRYYVSIGKEGQEFELEEELAENTYSNNNETREEGSEVEQLTYPSIEEMRKAQSGSSNQEAKPKGALHNRNKKEKKERKSPEERRNSPSLGQILFGDTAEEKQEETEQLKEAEEELQDEKEMNELAEEEKVQKKEEKVPLIEEVAKEKLVNPTQKEDLLDDNYKANNVIFLIDASNSMNNNGKMQLLQTSMTQLLKPLRSIDYLSIVTYAGNARVLLAPTSAVEKDSIKEGIFNIEAEGSTQAVKGLNTAIDVGLSNFIENGNNQIILATDGAFDIGERNTRLRERIEKAAQKGLKITVVGIKNENYTNSSLKEIADLGDGKLIRLKKKKHSNRLLEYVKESALISY